ncbi:MAG: methylmalonyl-CoA mutase family protein [Actinomycetota bacterium]|nr:methylmalonyl-CoA mutase family protein [Actinomycetota bacterium]
MPLESTVRIVTATSLFDGHDASINIMRRILQASGAEVIHLGHDRSAAAIAKAAVEEDAHAVAITSYQGGHMEFFTYLRSLLDDAGGHDIKIFGGGGGTILPSEGDLLVERGIARIYSPDDGRRLGLEGMIADLMASARTEKPVPEGLVESVTQRDAGAIGRAITVAENHPEEGKEVLDALRNLGNARTVPVVGFTGTGGSGKSSIVDELVLRFRRDFPSNRIAIISVDPSRRRSGGALLGDRIRMNAVEGDQCYMRSLATRQANLSMSPHVSDAVSIVKAAGYDLVFLETSGIGQSDTQIVDSSDVAVYVMTPEYGAPTQLEKIDMLDFADVIAINKADRLGADDALRDVRKQYKRNHKMFEAQDSDLPVYATVASRFNDAGTQTLYEAVMAAVDSAFPGALGPVEHRKGTANTAPLIPRARVRYLSEISETIRTYNAETARFAETASALEAANRVRQLAPDAAALIVESAGELSPDTQSQLDAWDATSQMYAEPTVSYEVRGKTIEVGNVVESMSGTTFPKVIHPRIRGWGDRVEWLRQENLPGHFPFTAGVFPFKREAEDPTRMFAGEGGPEQTNRRFHYLASGMPAARLSTAFDSVTLYGHEPDPRPDVYGKVGNSGVSVPTLDDAKKLYSGFNLCDPTTSVSMTINGPAPMMLAFFLNTATDQACERYIIENGLEATVEARVAAIFTDRGVERPEYHGELPLGHDGSGLMLLGMSGSDILDVETYGRIRSETIAAVRGTIQADILKEDQAQNTCIFSTEFALGMQGDIQEYFIENGVRNFYSVSISGYHMAEAGANPISQLAFTLANGFTFVEYFRARGMDIDDFAPSLSFFFSNGIDPEYAVIGRVARRIWAKAMREIYGGSGQKLKYHIQTSGRSLHAQEIEFNDIRTTLQALYAIYDNCNSLHTNAYDEAVTTPTEDSVRRALAIQLIINRELGLAKNENPMQGSFIIQELTDLVEEAVLMEFDRITDRGGVLGAMESMYQRSKIQEESMRYEHMKDSGELELIGVNSFLSKEGSPFVTPDEVIRSDDGQKDQLIADVKALHDRERKTSEIALAEVQNAALNGENIFAALMEATKVCSLGQLSDALFAVGGKYRRNM